jgi:hypothetical protein
MAVLSQSRTQVCVHVFSSLELFQVSRDILYTNTTQHAQRSRKTRSRILEPQHALSQNVTQHNHKMHALFVCICSREQILVKFSNSRDRYIDAVLSVKCYKCLKKLRDR